MPKIFLSYRRHDTQAIVGRLYDRLIAKFGKNEVIRDLDSISLGVDFRQFLSDSVAKCNVLIAVIGDDWKGVSQDGRSRIDDESDFVRIEIASALTRGIPVNSGSCRQSYYAAVFPTSCGPEKSDVPSRMVDRIGSCI